MNPEQRKKAIEYATDAYPVGHTMSLDVSTEDDEGFDHVLDGVWIRAWVHVPAVAIPGYALETSPPSTVTVTKKAPCGA